MEKIKLSLALLAFIASPALAAGDAEKGEKVFRKCAACHVIAPDGPKRNGPNLYAVVGRPVGAQEDFAYSEALRAAGDAGDIWSEERLADYLENPKALYKGNKMSFAGLAKPEDRADLIAYLKTQAPQE